MAWRCKPGCLSMNDTGAKECAACGKKRGKVAKGSSSAMGDHRGLDCGGCGRPVRSKDPFLWLEGSGAAARAWHFDCHPLVAKLRAA